jgi:hypothetical protein
VRRREGLDSGASGAPVLKSLPAGACWGFLARADAVVWHDNASVAEKRCPDSQDLQSLAWPRGTVISGITICPASWTEYLPIGCLQRDPQISAPRGANGIQKGCRCHHLLLMLGRLRLYPFLPWRRLIRPLIFPRVTPSYDSEYAYDLYGEAVRSASSAAQVPLATRNWTRHETSSKLEHWRVARWVFRF